MTVLIDSWSWIEYWKGGRHSAKAAAHIESSDTAILSPINMAEIYHSILRDYNEKTAREKAETLRRRCFIVPLSDRIAVDAAHVKHSLRLSLADSIILATARSREAKVVTGDKDFREIPDVIFIAE